MLLKQHLISTWCEEFRSILLSLTFYEYFCRSNDKLLHMLIIIKRAFWKLKQNDKQVFVVLFRLVWKFIDIFSKIVVHSEFLLTSAKSIQHYGNCFLDYFVSLMCANMCFKFNDHRINGAEIKQGGSQTPAFLRSP